MQRFVTIWLLLVAATVLLLDQQPSIARHMRGGGSPPPPAPFSSVSFGPMSVYGNGACGNPPPPGFASPCIFADTFWNTWGAGGTIYAWTADTTEFNLSGGNNSNMAFNSLSNFSSSMVGTPINIMSQWGGLNQQGADNATYKPSTLMSMRGTLIASALRQCYTCTPGILSSQLIKSTNSGGTWTPAPPMTAQPYASPTFTDGRFRAPYFFQYGQDYQSQTVDRSSEFVYALSYDFTDSTSQDKLVVGRVPISLVANLSASDWQFFQGGDGSLDANWGALATTAPVCTAAFQSGIGSWYSGGVQYLPAFGTYMLIGYTQNSGETSTQFYFYQLTHPWGPCTMTTTSPVWNSSNPQGPPNGYAFYFPALVQASVGTDGGHHMVMLFAGNEALNFDFYTMFIAPIVVN